MIKEGLLTSVMGEENRDVHSDKITQLLSHLSIKQCDKMTLNVTAKLVRKTNSSIYETDTSRLISVDIVFSKVIY
jgi:hypothetical protein